MLPLCSGHSDALCLHSITVFIGPSDQSHCAINRFFSGYRQRKMHDCSLRLSLLSALPPPLLLPSVSVSVFFNAPNSCTSAHIDVTGAKKLLTVCRRSSKNVLCLLRSPCAMMKHDEKQLMMRRTKPQIIYCVHARTHHTALSALSNFLKPVLGLNIDLRKCLNNSPDTHKKCRWLNAKLLDYRLYLGMFTRQYAGGLLGAKSYISIHLNVHGCSHFHWISGCNLLALANCRGTVP